MGTPTGGIAGTIPHSVVHEHRCERRTVKPLRDEKHSSIPASLLWSQRYPLFCVRAHTHTRSKHTVSLCACRRRTRGGRERARVPAVRRNQTPFLLLLPPLILVHPFIYPSIDQSSPCHCLCWEIVHLHWHNRIHNSRRRRRSEDCRLVKVSVLLSLWFCWWQCRFI